MSQRFTRELGFVQALCNPDYLRFLHQNDYFKEQKFKDFLEYLKYWKDEPYKNFIMYPQCLEILDLLSNESFIDFLGDESFCNLLGEQQFNIWKNED